MKKGVYIIYTKLTETTGVIKKIQGQIKAFENAGFHMSTVHMDIKKVPGWKIIYRLPFTNVLPYWRWFDEFGDCDFIYFRHPRFMNLAFLRLLKQIKRRNPKVKIIMELPTYPYDKELLQCKKDIPVFIKDWFMRKWGWVKKYIDVIAVLTLDDTVFSIPTIRIKNGFDFSKIRIKKAKEAEKDINLVMCALMEEWHGYERLINGLAEYYQNSGERNIILHFVGEGPELGKYKNLVHGYGMDSHAVFYGTKRWNEIIEIYDNCTIGVSSMGAYKTGIDYLCSLKTREYLAAGLPVIGAGQLDISEYDDLEKYILCFPNDSSNISVEKIIQFYDRLYYGKSRNELQSMANNIRNIAEKNLNMDAAMQNVITYIEQSC